MQGSLGGRSSHEEENHERGSSCRVGWAVRERETTVHVMDERYCYAHCNSVLTSAWLAGRVKTYVMLYVNHNHSNTRGGKLRQSSSHVAEWTEDNRYSFRVAFIELRVRRSTPAHGWLVCLAEPSSILRPTTPVIAAGRDRCFQFSSCVVYHYYYSHCCS